MSDLGNPVRIKFLSSLAFSIALQRSTTDKAIKPPGKNWAKAFQDRHPEVRARTVKALDWNRHEKNIYNKVTQWFDVIERVLRDPAILAENVYNMDETGVMLSKRRRKPSGTALACAHEHDDGRPGHQRTDTRANPPKNGLRLVTR